MLPVLVTVRIVKYFDYNKSLRNVNLKHFETRSDLTRSSPGGNNST